MGFARRANQKKSAGQLYFLSGTGNGTGDAEY
jgi:hypothetical protein